MAAVDDVITSRFYENRFFYQKRESIATKLAHDSPHMGLHPGCAQGQGQRSRDTDILRFDENRFFYHKHDSIATKLAYDAVAVLRWGHGAQPLPKSCSAPRSKFLDTVVLLLVELIGYIVISPKFRLAVVASQIDEGPGPLKYFS